MAWDQNDTKPKPKAKSAVDIQIDNYALHTFKNITYLTIIFIQINTNTTNHTDDDSIDHKKAFDSTNYIGKEKNHHAEQKAFRPSKLY